MTDTTDAANTETVNDGGEQKQEQTFTQADVDRIVSDRLKRQAKDKFGDYEELRTKAGEKATADERIADLEQKYAAAEAARLRSDVAARHGISPEDRDLFLNGSDEETLTAQAQRLTARDSERKQQRNVAPREGHVNKSGNPEEQATRDFLAQLNSGEAT